MSVVPIKGIEFIESYTLNNKLSLPFNLSLTDPGLLLQLHAVQNGPD